MIDRLAEYTRPNSQPSSSAWSALGMPNNADMQQQAKELAGRATRWIMAHPELALGSAVVTGVVLGWFIKRR